MPKHYKPPRWPKVDRTIFRTPDGFILRVVNVLPPSGDDDVTLSNGTHIGVRALKKAIKNGELTEITQATKERR